MSKLAEHPRLLFEIGKLLKHLEDELGDYHVNHGDFFHPFVKLTPMINEATRRGIVRKNRPLDRNIMAVMCWIADTDWMRENLTPDKQTPLVTGYTFGGASGNMYVDGELLSTSEYAQKYNVPAVTVKQRAAAGLMLTARKIGENWVIDSDEPFV